MWVPDYEEERKSLSGELSHSNHFHKNVNYIGPQSRLQDVISEIEKDKYDYLILLSGPEPTRTELEKALLEKLKSSDKKVAFVRGSQEVALRQAQDDGKEQEAKRVKIFDFPTKEELKKLILSSKKIICRSGYSTLMDMHLLGKKDLILIPTPGQTEQEYLAKYWEGKFGAKKVPQSEINKLITFVS